MSKHKVDIQQSPFIFIFDSVSQHSSLLIVIMSVWDLREVYSEFTFKYYVHSLQCNVNAKELNAFYYITNAFLCYAFLDKTKVFLPFTLFWYTLACLSTWLWGIQKHKQKGRMISVILTTGHPLLPCCWSGWECRMARAKKKLKLKVKKKLSIGSQAQARPSGKEWSTMHYITTSSAIYYLTCALLCQLCFMMVVLVPHIHLNFCLRFYCPSVSPLSAKLHCFIYPTMPSHLASFTARQKWNNEACYLNTRAII